MEQKKTELRMSLTELKLIRVDELFMVVNATLLYIHQRLKYIFATPNSKLLAGVSILAVSDLYKSHSTVLQCAALLRMKVKLKLLRDFIVP